VANGFYGTEDEWIRLENPLGKLDAEMQKFAKTHQLVLIKNEKGSPNRSFRWGENPQILIQVYLESDKSLTYTLWVCASDNRSRAEYWKHQRLLKASPIDVLAEELPDLLQRAYAMANEWIKDYIKG
jgi:hypothetical protein